MKFKEIFTEGKASSEDNIKAIEKFIKGFDNPSRSPEDKFYDYSNSRIRISNTYEADLKYSDIISGLDAGIQDVVTLKVTEHHTELIGTKEIIGKSVDVRIQVGYNSDGVIKSESVTDVSTSSLKKAYKTVLKKLRNDKSAKLKILAEILKYRKPLSKSEAKKSTSMGHASMSSTVVQTSYEEVVDISDLLKIFDEKDFQAAVNADYSLKKSNISFNFEDGLMDKSGTWSETWD